MNVATGLDNMGQLFLHYYEYVSKFELRNLQLQGILLPPNYFFLTLVVILFELAISIISFYTCYKSFELKATFKGCFFALVFSNQSQISLALNGMIAKWITAILTLLLLSESLQADILKESSD